MYQPQGPFSVRSMAFLNGPPNKAQGLRVPIEANWYSIRDHSHLPLGFYMEQQVVNNVQDHGILSWVGGDFQLMMDKGESIHSP